MAVELDSGHPLLPKTGWEDVFIYHKDLFKHVFHKKGKLF
jgi:hypothetical protein